RGRAKHGGDGRIIPRPDAQGPRDPQGGAGRSQRARRPGGARRPTEPRAGSPRAAAHAARHADGAGPRGVRVAALRADRPAQDRGAAQPVSRVRARGRRAGAARPAPGDDVSVPAGGGDVQRLRVHRRHHAHRGRGSGAAVAGSRPVSYVPRTYDLIVRDRLTTLTGGTVRETLKAPAGTTVVTPAKLRNRPVRRVSSLDGFVGTPDKPVPYRFTAAD